MDLDKEFGEIRKSFERLYKEFSQLKADLKEHTGAGEEPDRWMDMQEAIKYLGRGRKWVMARLQSVENPDGIRYTSDGGYSFRKQDLDNYMLKNYSDNIFKKSIK